jgi:acyl phosphate:glycerol-3-phosphate acyltransferase
MVGALALGYLAGSVPSADVATRLAAVGRSHGGVDLRSQGSGNPGGANAMALLGRRWGYGVMAADIAKGAVACAVGRLLADGSGAHGAGVAAVVGHCFPVWSRFRGGKGVATSVGQCAATFPAWSPFDLALAGAVAASPRWRRRARTTTAIASVGWVLAAATWWRRGWPNLWGPRPSAALPLAAAASSAVIVSRFGAAPSPPAPTAAADAEGTEGAEGAA